MKVSLCAVPDLAKAVQLSKKEQTPPRENRQPVGGLGFPLPSLLHGELLADGGASPCLWGPGSARAPDAKTQMPLRSQARSVGTGLSKPHDCGRCVPTRLCPLPPPAPRGSAHAPLSPSSMGNRWLFPNPNSCQSASIYKWKPTPEAAISQKLPQPGRKFKRPGGAQQTQSCAPQNQTGAYEEQEHNPIPVDDTHLPGLGLG